MKKRRSKVKVRPAEGSFFARDNWQVGEWCGGLTAARDRLAPARPERVSLHSAHHQFIKLCRKGEKKMEVSAIQPAMSVD